MKTFKCMTKPKHDGKPLDAVPSPIFELGVVPLLPHCKIIEREYREDGKWHYGIINSYNGYGSGWADEDWIIGQITKEQQRVARQGTINYNVGGMVSCRLRANQLLKYKKLQAGGNASN